LSESERDQPAEPGQGRPSSVWAGMFLSGPDDQDEPAPGTGYGGHRALGSLPPSEPLPSSGPLPRRGPGQPFVPEQWFAPDQPEPGAEGGQQASGPWETYEKEEGYGWAGGYGMVPGPSAAPGAAAQGTAAPGTGGSGGEAPPGRGAQLEPGHRPTWQDDPADSLTADLLLPGRHAAPPAGWRRTLLRITGGLMRAPQSAAERRRRDLIMRARAPVTGGHHRVAVLSLKGGVGKTITAVGLGATLASLRGDRIIIVDANPDRGTLSDRFRLETAATVRDLLNEQDQIQRSADARAYTTQAASGLEVLASDRDPTVSIAFSAQDYEDVARILERYCAVCVTDCGTGLLHSAMAGVLRLADQVVLVTSPSVDGARSASATLDWLAAHQRGDLVRDAVVVISAIRPQGKSGADLARLAQHFAARCRAVVRVPYDAHLAEGAEVDVGRLGQATADAYLALAAEVGDSFSRPRPRRLT
jgi:MinD-like ATPase involved in chromosome partitioning or flagellar assembly